MLVKQHVDFEKKLEKQYGAHTTPHIPEARHQKLDILDFRGALGILANGCKVRYGLPRVSSMSSTPALNIF